MRAKDFLTESVLRGTSSASWLGYLKNMLTVDSISIGDKGEKDSDLVLSPGSKKAIKGLVARIESGEDVANMKAEIESTALTFTNSKASYQIKQVFKSPEIKSGAGGDAGGKEGKKYWNDGEVAETFLGAALFARFKSNKPITEADVLSVLTSSKSSETGFTNKAKRKNDPITLVDINKPLNNQVVMEYIGNKAKLQQQFPKGVKGLDIAIRSCVAYVNESSKVQEAISEIESNTNTDVVEVKTDGVSDQKGTKADLQLKIGDKIRLLSLKVNAVKQFGQDTGATPEVITQFFRRFIPDAKINPGIVKTWPEMSRSNTNALKKAGTLSQTYNQIYGLIGQVYASVGQQLQAKLAKSSSAAALVDDLYNGIIHHAQGAAEGQTLVILNPGKKKLWQELEFGPELANAMRSFKLEATVGVAGTGGEQNHIIRIFGRPVDAKASVAMATNIDTPQQAQAAAKQAATGKVTANSEMLIQLRSYVQEAGPTIRNIVEMGPLLKTITEVQDINKVEPTVQQQPVPVAKPQVKAPKPMPANPQTPPAGIQNQQKPLKVSKVPMGQ